MTEKRLCENCNREFDAEEIMVEQKIERGGAFIIINDLEYENICPDCKNDLDIEDEEELTD